MDLKNIPQIDKENLKDVNHTDEWEALIAS